MIPSPRGSNSSPPKASPQAAATATTAPTTPAPAPRWPSSSSRPSTSRRTQDPPPTRRSGDWPRSRIAQHHQVRSALETVLGEQVGYVELRGPLRHLEEARDFPVRSILHQ